jgi:ABC-type bacteriocin/lantibiotic exporter with double-glycine peptidase domain
MKIILSSFQNILTRTERIKIFILIAIFIFNALFELLGLGLMMSIFYLMIDEKNFTLIINKSIFFENYTYNEIINICAIGLVIIFLLKSALVFFTNLIQSKIFTDIHFRLANKLLLSYLNKEYNFFFSRNRAKLAFNIANEIEQICIRLINPILNIISETIIVILILSFFIFQFKNFLIYFIIFVSFYLLFYFFTKNISFKLGEVRKYNELNKAAILKDIFNGIKQIKMQNIEIFFYNQFGKLNKRALNAFVESSIIGFLPKIIIELIVIIFIASFIIYFNYKNEIREAIPILGITFLLVVRLMPSLNKIITALNTVKFTMPSLQNIYKDLTDNDEKKNTTYEINELIVLNKNIQLKNITFQYKNFKKKILENANLEIVKNSFIGIKGPSGSGKTTLIDIIAGLLKPTSGHILIDDVNINNLHLNKIIGYMGQETFLFNDKLIKNIALGVEENKINLKKINQTLNLAKLDDFTFNLPGKLDFIIGENGINISGGEKQRIGIARLLYFDYPVIIFDEATNALDNINESEILETIYSLKGLKTIILISHKIENLRKCDNIYEIKEGKII